MWYPRETHTRSIRDVEVKTLEGIAESVSQKLLRESAQKNKTVEDLQAEIYKLDRWQHDLIGEQQMVLEEANEVRAKCEADIKVAKRKGARAVKEMKDAQEKSYVERIEHNVHKLNTIAQYGRYLKGAQLTNKREVAILKHGRQKELNRRKNVLTEMREESRDKLQALRDQYQTQHCKLETQLMLAEDRYGRSLRTRDENAKRVRELKLLTDSRAVFKNWINQDEVSYRPLESEWYRLMNEEKKLKHRIHVELQRIIPIQKLIQKMPELVQTRKKWEAMTPLFQIWTPAAMANGQLLEQRYSDQTAELVKDYDARDEMLHHRFVDKFDELEFEKNARVANALKLCQEEKEALEKVIADAETQLRALKRDATNAATEMGALRIEVANLEDAVIREELLVASQERDLAASQAALLAESFRGRVHQSKQVITALVPGLERTNAVFADMHRPPSPLHSPKHSPKHLGLAPTEDHRLQEFAFALATIEEPKHEELSTLCGTMTDLQREILRIGADEAEPPAVEEPAPVDMLDLQTRAAEAYPESATMSWKFAQALAEFEVPQELRSPPRAGPHLGTDPLQDTLRADRLVEAADIWARTVELTGDGADTTLDLDAPPKLGATESTRVPEEGHTQTLSALGTADITVLEGGFASEVDRITSDMAATADGIQASIAKLDVWKDLFDESKPPTPKPATPRHLFSRMTPAYSGVNPREIPDDASDVPTEASEPLPDFVTRAFDDALLRELDELEHLGLRYNEIGVAASRVWATAREEMGSPTASSVGVEDNLFEDD